MPTQETGSDNTERSIGRLEGKVDQFMVTAANVERAVNQLENKRIPILEQKVANLMGKIAVMASAIAAGVSVIVSIAQKIFGN